jgi:hypothetical protein
MSLAEMIRKGPRVRRATATLATDTDALMSGIASVATVAPENTPKATSSARTRVESVVEAAGRTARTVYWEDEHGAWHGPVQPEYLGRTKVGFEEQVWVIVEHNGEFRWISAESLRSRRAYLARQHNGT